MITKEQALDHIAEVYEYSITALGFNHPMSRELYIWIQRTWLKAGVDRANQIRRTVTQSNKEKKTVAPGMTEAEAKGLKVFSGSTTQISGERFRAPLKQMAPPKVSRIETPEEAKQELPQTEPIEKNERIAAVELTAAELESITDLKPRAILMQFKEAAIELTLKTVFGVEEEDIPNSGSQKAALLKQKVIEAGKK